MNPKLALGLKDLEPLMLFSNFRRIWFDIDWQVNLGDYEMLTFASAWPHLEQLHINETWC
ncbi:hypothetical protein V8E55_010477 [Tylopilus felleus]